MAGIGLKIDPTGENAANVPLDLNDGVHFRAMKANYPTPPRKVNWASSADTEGSLPANLQYDNRSITIEARVYGTSASDLQTQLGYLEQKVGKINEVAGVGGTQEYVSPSGVVCIFDLLEAAADFELDNAALANKRVVVTITFTAKPFWRSGLANETSGSDHVETTLPVAIGIDTAVGGDVPALGRLVIDEDQGQDQWTAIWGVQCQNYDSSADAALFYQAESRTPQGGAATAELAGASGSGKNTVLQSTLTATYQSMLSTQASGGNHLKNVGIYRAFTRVWRPTPTGGSNSGEVSICLEWGEGDLRRRTRNGPVVLGAEDRRGQWVMIDLGLVTLTQAVTGTPKWEGRILAKSTNVGDDLYVDWLLFFPVEEGYGTSKVVPVYEAPAVFSARDEFEQTVGALNGKVLPLGGTWATEGAATDFTINPTFKALERNNPSVDGGEVEIPSGRLAFAGAATYGAIVVSVDISATSDEGAVQGLLARWTNANNCVFLVFTGAQLRLRKIVGGVGKELANTNTNAPFFEWPFGAGYNPMRMRLMIDAAGRCAVWVGQPEGTPRLILTASDSDLATGGTLATGKIGIRDFKQGIPNTRYYDNFHAFVPTTDAAVFASQSMEVRSDRALREDAAGTTLVKAPNYKGRYFTVPPSRREGRTVRTVVKLSRNNPDLPMSDPGIDDLSFKIFWQQRGLVLPES